MTKLLVPTRNRAASMGALLGYLGEFHPGTHLIVADGSDDVNKDEIQAVCEKYSTSLTVDYKSYPADLPLFERILDVLLTNEDHCFAMGADDDYPVMEVIEEAEKILFSDSDCECVVPGDVVLTLRPNGDLTSRLSHSRNVIHSSPITRAKDFSYWHFATSYGVSRRASMIQRYRMLSKLYCASFIDFQIGLEDALNGKIRAIEKIGYIRTQTYEHEYFRATESLIFLRKSERILEYRDYLVTQLKEIDDTSEQEAKKLADMLVSRRISDLTGGGAPSKRNFTETKQFKDRIMQAQYKNFYELFQSGSDMREKYLPRLRYAADVLFSDVARSENIGPVANYESV